MLGVHVRRLAYFSVALLGACGARTRGPRPQRPEPTVIEVDNQGFSDMNVYVYQGTQRVRLGMAMGASVTKLTLPRNMERGIRTLRFLADPIGGRRRSVSQEITVSPGDTVRLTIPPG